MTGQARASTTDPGARVMKMADGGFRPAFNGQFEKDTTAQVIVGVDVSNAGSDLGQFGADGAGADALWVGAGTPLPHEVVARTRARYLEALGRLTGLSSENKEDGPCR